MNAPNRLLPKAIALAVTGFARLVTGVRPEWRGCQPAPGRRVYFANHASHGDFVLIWTVLPAALRRATRPVAASDYWGGDGLRGYIGRAVFNAALIDRTPEPGRQHPIDYLRSVLAEGSSLIFFPEGTRNTTDAVLLPFKSGLFRLAEGDTETEFIPVWIDNLSRVMPKGQFLPIPLLCSVTFGAPMRHVPGEEKAAFLDRAREALLALKPKGSGE